MFLAAFHQDLQIGAGTHRAVLHQSAKRVVTGVGASLLQGIYKHEKDIDPAPRCFINI